MNELQGARVVENREVARATRWLVFESDDPFEHTYGPGNVIAFYVQELGGKWIRHPYTVSWADGRRIGLLFRVIPGGRATPVMADLRPGEIVRFGGRFGEPIAAIVAEEATEVVGISTGTGIGPLHGFAEAARAAGFSRPVTLYAGFRSQEDVVLAPELDRLAADWPSFRWHRTLSAPRPGWEGLAGRVTHTVPPRIPRTAHVHLVGNGAMVWELRAGLLAAGFPVSRVTYEIYFNRTATPDPGTVERIALAAGGPTQA